MARIVLNPAIRVISGDVSGFVYRQQSDGSVVLAKETLPDPERVLSEAQQAHLQRFKEASARYRRLIEDEGVKAAYEKIMAERGSTARMRAMVIGDILKAPKIGTIDLSNYTGAIGNTIRVVAEDNVGISRLELSVFDMAAGTVVETAQMPVDGKVAGMVEWVYTATVDVPAAHPLEVKAAAYDLAGNQIVSSATANE